MAKRDVVPGLPEKLKAAREAKGLTQAEAAEASGSHQGNISLFEKGEKTPTLATLIKLAAAYGVKAADLIPEQVEGEEVTAPEKDGAKQKKGKK